jgi:hypothetical protein
MKMFVLTVLLFSIASQAATRGLRLNPDLLRPWSKELSASQPFPYPYLATFKKDGFVLAYLAADHANRESSPTMALLRRTLEKGSFQAVMFEGFPFDASSADQERFLQYANSTRRGGLLEGGEDAYAAILAHSKGLPFYGGEPTGPQVLQGVLARDYSARDMVGFSIVRMIPVWTRDGELKDKSLDALAADRLRSECRGYGLRPADCPDLASLKLWYLTKNGEEFGDPFDGEKAAPYAGGKYFTQRLSAAVDDVRNRAIVQHVEKLLLKHRKILVVYGGSHLPMQSKAFEEALGTPAYSR